MKIFYSWSGSASNDVAKILSKWVSLLLPTTYSYISSDDIDKGMSWTHSLSKELEDSKIGILCITQENIQAPWLLFEAGALSKNMRNDSIIPFLFKVYRSEIDGPIVQFQNIEFEKKDIKKLIYFINSKLNNNKLNDEFLESTFNNNYKKLEHDLNKISVNNKENYEYTSEIKRVITFEPEYYASGISILQNFGKLLRDKYGETPAKVTITQEGLKVRMVIIPPSGKKHEVEEYLHKYGLVVTGEIKPEEFLQDPIQALELRTELKLAYTRVEIQKEHMVLIDSQHSTQISSLEEQVTWLRNQVGNSLALHQKNTTELLKVLESSNKEIIYTLIESIDNRNLDQLKETIDNLKQDNPENFSKLESFISNTISSAGANAPAWIEFISKVLSV